ncbi:hypothetical protein C7974DRAFT_93435 [Boeremia exigua]|uniref:uncharacterized protein n=1 Tax=Boeremia exigua TaxID=749465 RepID=UPI001E8DA22C|nr:uncharacterized protein C7974DRAFT_93435 [Boeremia exigua]KAH6641998.1 hypothetical protein C7974DRAFT_93435 [Boeremia exigua]
MRTSSILAPLFFAASSLAQAVEEGIEPSTPAPAGCLRTVEGNFTIGVENFFAPRSKRETAQQAADGALLCTLEDGILRDQYSRTGSVVANRQFQFDGPPQAGAIYTGGFAVCENGSLAIGGSTRWWRCMSGAFGNLYDETIGDQCTEIRIVVDLLNDPSPSSSAVPSTSASISSRPTGGASITSSSSTAASPSGASSAVSNGTSSASAGSTSGTATTSVSSTGSSSASVTESASGTSSATAGGAAPPAEGGAATFISTQGTVLGALLTVFGAALIL